MADDRSAGPVLLTALAAAGLLMAAYGRETPAPVARGDGRRAQPGQRSGAARGRDATSPAQIPARGWWDVLKRVAKGFSDDRLMTEAAGVTFFALLALFPAIATMISLYGLFADPKSVSDQLQSLGGIVPGGGLDIIKDQVASLTSKGSQALGFSALFGLLTSLWSANQGIKSLFDALNVVYHEHEERSFVRRTLISLTFTLGAIVFVLLALAAIVVVPVVLAYIGLDSVVHTLLTVSRWPLMTVVTAVLLALIYRYGPDRRRARWQWVSWGSAFSAIGWILGSVAFSYYVANFGSYNKTYGSLGAAIGFMTWIWISTIIVLLGAELNSELERQTERDSTVGPEKPRGARDAAPADMVA